MKISNLFPGDQVRYYPEKYRHDTNQRPIATGVIRARLQQSGKVTIEDENTGKLRNIDAMDVIEVIK